MVIFHSGFKVLGTACVAFFESPSVRTTYCIQSVTNLSDIYNAVKEGVLTGSEVPFLSFAAKFRAFDAACQRPAALKKRVKSAQGHTFITLTFSIKPVAFVDSVLESDPPPLFLDLDPGVGLVLRLLAALLVYDLSRLGREMRTMMAVCLGMLSPASRRDYCINLGKLGEIWMWMRRVFEAGTRS